MSLISGLTIIPDLISQQTHDALLEIIDQQSWRKDLKRRVQHYGYVYDYKARKITPDLYLGSLPEWLNFSNLANWFQQQPNQVIINEYQPGQGISSHIDCVPCFSDTIASISLGSACPIDFSRNSEKYSILLEPRTLLVMQDAARYKWQHSIAARKSDMVAGERVQRGRRVSLTFRKVLI